MSKYNLTWDESKAYRKFSVGMLASTGIIMASIMAGLFEPNRLFGMIIMIGGSSIGFLILIYTIRENDKAYKKLYPEKEE